MGEDKPYKVVHVSGAHHIGAIVVRPLEITRVGAVVRHFGRIGHEPGLVVHQWRACRPIPRLLGPGLIQLLASVAVQSRSDLEKHSVRDRVLHGISTLVRLQLPTQTTATFRGIPSILLGVEDTLRQREPREFTRVRQLQLGRMHGS